MFKIKKNITKEELIKMGFSKLAVELVYSRRGNYLVDILGEARNKRFPYPTLQNIHSILVIKTKKVKV